jgi:hypothetical protein
MYISFGIDFIICHQDTAELKKIFGPLKSPTKAFLLNIQFETAKKNY